MLRRLAAVAVAEEPLGLCASAVESLCPATEGVADERGRCCGACGSTEAAVERRDCGLEGTGGVDSVLGATEVRWTLAARVVGVGVEALDG